MKSSFELFTDPGHGWVKVERSLLISLGIADKISCYSYQRGEFVYLEEDCDSTHLIDALIPLNLGKCLRFRIRHANHRSRIRDYNPYKKDVP